MDFKLNCLNENIIYCNEVKEAALYLRCDIANLCGEIAKKMSPKKEMVPVLQIELMGALANCISEMALAYGKNLYYGSRDDGNGKGK